MDVLELLQTPLAERIGLVLVHSLWQGALVALALAAALRLLRQARHRYLAACAAMGLVLVLPLATFSLISEVTYRNVGAVLATTARSLASSWTLPGQEASLLSGTEWLNLLLPWAVGVWAVGVAVLSVRLAGGLFATGRLRQGAIPAAAWIDQRVRELALQLGVRKRIRAAITDRIASPVVLGWIKPLVLLPMGALTRLTPQQLEAILVHELAHVRRHDYLINLVQRIAETLLFYHPAVWWIGRRMREEREYCCDDIAITTCGNVRLYAHALVSLQMSAQSYPLAMAATGDPLLGRISRLMQRPGDGPSPSVRTSASGTFLIVACVLAVAMRSVVFPAAEARAHSSHTLGQRQPSFPEERRVSQLPARPGRTGKVDMPPLFSLSGSRSASSRHVIRDEGRHVSRSDTRGKQSTRLTGTDPAGVRTPVPGSEPSVIFKAAPVLEAMTARTVEVPPLLAIPPPLPPEERSAGRRECVH